MGLSYAPLCLMIRLPVTGALAQGYGISGRAAGFSYMPSVRPSLKPVLALAIAALLSVACKAQEFLPQAGPPVPGPAPAFPPPARDPTLACRSFLPMCRRWASRATVRRRGLA